MNNKGTVAQYSRALILLASFVLSPSVWAAASHNASHDWKTMSTPHFRIHYHDGLEGLAKKAAAIAEDVHVRYSKILNWQPEEPTNIILTDEIGLANGWATPVPDNRQGIYVTPPTDSNTLEDHGGWLETVITHEYIHTLHLDKVSGFPKFMREVLGRYPSSFIGFIPVSVFPNAFQPRWLTEGIATYYETDQERGIGRGQSSIFSMMMRMEVDKGVKSYNQVNQYTVEWPSGTIPYLYGVHFYDFMVEKKGDQAIIKLVEDYSNDGIPYRLNANMSGVFGKNITPVWDDFSAYLNQRYRPQIERLKASGLVEGERLTQHGYDTGMSQALNGDVFYLRSNALRRPSLMVLRKGESEPDHLTDVHFSASFDIHPRAGIVLAQPEYCGNAQLYYDLYRVSPKSGWTTRLTRCGQYHEAAWHPDGNSIVAARIHNSRSSLVRLDGKGGLPEVLWQASDDTTLGQLDWSPDGSHIVASVWRPQHGWDLEEFDIASGHWSRITNKKVIELYPRYNKDGDSILFSADYDGIYNIHRLDRSNRKVTRISNVPGGAFSPAVDGNNGAIYYTGYDAEGMDIYRLEPSQMQDLVATASVGPSANVRQDWAEVSDARIDDYSPWSSMRPRWWLPHAFFSDQVAEFGVSTSGTDVLNRHIYGGTIAYDADNGWPVGAFDYIYDRWWPIFKLHASRFSDIDLNSDDETERVRRDDMFQAEFVFPWLSLDRTLTTHIGAARVRESDGYISRSLGIVEEPEEDDRLAGIAFVYNSSKWFPRSVSRNDGRQVNIVAESSEMIEGGDYTGSIYSVDWREFWPLWGEHVLAWRFVGARSTKQPRPFELGGAREAGGTPYLLDSTLVNSPFGQRDYALRGYPTGLPWLRGRNMHLGTVEYRFPVSRIERGITIPPVGVRQIHGALFVDYGAAWNSEQEVATKYLAGAGIEAHVELMAFYGGNLDLRLGYAKGYHLGGERQSYIGIGASF